jgi:hypothetical protein
MKRLASIAVAVVLTCMVVMVNTAYAEHDSLTGGNEQDNGTEFHVVDDLYVGGWNGTWDDADVEIYGFSMFGSTTAYNNRWGDWSSSLESKMPTTSTGAVVILGDLVVGSTVYFHRSVEFNAISTFTAGATFPTGSSVTYSSIGNIWVNDGTTGWAIRKASNGNLEWYNPAEYGDDLGDHTATTTLNMNGYDIIKIKELSLGSSENVKISTATTQFGGPGAGVLISTHAEVAGQLYVGGAATMASALNVTGNATMSANLTVNGNSTLGNDPDTNTLTVNAHTTIAAEASPTSGEKFLQVGSGSNVVAYFKKK